MVSGQRRDFEEGPFGVEQFPIRHQILLVDGDPRLDHVGLVVGEAVFSHGDDFARLDVEDGFFSLVARVDVCLVMPLVAFGPHRDQDSEKERNGCHEERKHGFRRGTAGGMLAHARCDEVKHSKAVARLSIAAARRLQARVALLEAGRPRRKASRPVATWRPVDLTTWTKSAGRQVDKSKGRRREGSEGP